MYIDVAFDYNASLYGGLGAGATSLIPATSSFEYSESPRALYAT
jgi:hypothetical protein